MRSLSPRLLLVLVLSACPAALPNRLRAEEPNTKQIYTKTLRGVAWALTPDGRGTAWVIDRANRLLVTNHHVVGNHETLEIIFPVHRDGNVVAESGYYLKEAARIRARVIDVSAADDLAILRADMLPADVNELKLATASPSPGDRVHSVGNPGPSGALWVYTSGTVRQVYQKKWNASADGRRIYRLDTRVIETQSPTNSGDSGGPLLNEHGDLIGVTQGGATRGQLVSWFVDVTRVREFLAITRRLQQPATAADFTERGARLLARGLHDRALADLNEALRRDPKLARAYGHRAAVFNARRDPDTAIADCNQALALDQTMDTVYVERGIANYNKGQYESAIADYTRAIQLRPDVARVYNNRGVAYSRTGRTDLAILSYSEALRLDPDFSLAATNRGLAHHARKDYKSAIADYTRGLQGRLNALTLNDRGDAFLALGMIEDAWKDYSQAVDVEPNAPLGWVNAAAVMLRKGQPDSAIKLCDKALSLNRNYSRAYFHRGEAFERKGLNGEAHLDYTEACKLDPAWAKLAPVQERRYLRVVNKSGQTLRMYLRYETKTKEGGWYWYHSGEGARPVVFTVAPGASVNLLDDGWRVQARRVRIWAEGTQGGVWLRDRDQDVWLAREPYRARNTDVFVYTFNP